MPQTSLLQRSGSFTDATAEHRSWQVLWVEDDLRFARTLLRMKPSWLCFDVVPTATKARDHVGERVYDAALVDLCIAGSVVAGFALIDTLRRLAPSMGIVVLSGWDSVPHRERALREGADDFAVKGGTVSLEDVGRRLIVAARRARQRADSDLPLGDLTDAEDRLLTLLRQSALVTTDEIAGLLGRRDRGTSADSAVKQLVSRLRRKLRGTQTPDVVIPVRGRGYRLRTPKPPPR